MNRTLWLAKRLETVGGIKYRQLASLELQRLHEASESWQRDYDQLLAENKSLQAEVEFLNNRLNAIVKVAEAMK